jgi:hypothetical protein
LSEMFERSPSDNSLNTTGIICRNVHMLLRRQESGSSLETPSGVTLEDGAHVLRCSSVTLEPGANKVAFRTQVRAQLGTWTQVGGKGAGTRKHCPRFGGRGVFASLTHLSFCLCP